MAKCPTCGKDMAEGKGELEQSGQTHLPTTTWTCTDCGVKTWEPARGEWVPDKYYEPRRI